MVQCIEKGRWWNRSWDSRAGSLVGTFCALFLGVGQWAIFISKGHALSFKSAVRINDPFEIGFALAVATIFLALGVYLLLVGLGGNDR